ncbi:MAG: glycosyltransferase family 1 protein [Candidatus Paceibacterota bacterium]
MKIGIDASRAFRAEKTGTEEYSYRLIRNLALVENSTHEVVLYVKRETEVDFALPCHFSLRKIGGNFLWTQLHLSSEILKRKVDVLFVPSHCIPVIHPARTVVTVHGLEYKNFPECYSLKDRIILEVNTKLSLLFAKKIIVPSKSTAGNLIKFYKVPSEKIEIVYHGSDGIKNFQKKNEGGSFNICFIGRIEKRKNIIGIVRAFNDFMKKIESSKQAEDVNANLILAGKAGFGFEEIEREILNSPYRKNISLLGFINEKEKWELYENADVFLFLSFAEGFGIPLLEAMSCGVPIITSNSSALAEVAGESAILVNPLNPAEIATALYELYQNESKRKYFKSRGYSNLEKFDWGKCARETWKVLSEWGG